MGDPRFLREWREESGIAGLRLRLRPRHEQVLARSGPPRATGVVLPPYVEVLAGIGSVLPATSSGDRLRAMAAMLEEAADELDRHMAAYELAGYDD